MAPKGASMTLKIGNDMEIIVANTTNIVLHINLKKLMLRSNFDLPRVRGYSPVTNFDDSTRFNYTK
jgi:hypothetical protein